MLAFGAAENAPQFQDGDPFHFQVWDSEADAEWEARASFTDGPTVWNDGAESALTLNIIWLARQTLALNQGWNMISLNVDPVEFYPDDEAPGPDHLAMFAQLADEDGNQNLDLLKDGAGRFWSPEWEFSNMNPWTAGQGYQVLSRAEEDFILNYPEPRANLAISPPNQPPTARWSPPLGTGANMSLLVAAIEGCFAGEGDQIAAFGLSGELLGAGEVTAGRCGLALWGDDGSTEAVDGAADGEAFSLKLWDAERQVEQDLRITQVQAGKAVYEQDGFAALTVAVQSSLPTSFYLAEAWPNPFNATIRLTFGLPEAGWINLSIFDLNGRLVEEVAKGEKSMGVHTIHWSAEGLPSGLYVARLEAGGQLAMRKLMLVK